MKIAPDLLEQIVDHARRDAPNECFGVVSSRDGVAEAVHELENVQASPRRFEAGPDLVRVYNEIDDAGLDLGAIYHSHTMSAPEPSMTDVNFAAGWPGVEWIIVGLKGDEPDVRSWLIEGDDAREVVLETSA